jgi:hypothetical protein
MKFSCIPPRPERGKAWHGRSINQGVAREHDELTIPIAGKNLSELRLEAK